MFKMKKFYKLQKIATLCKLLDAKVGTARRI